MSTPYSPYAVDVNVTSPSYNVNVNVPSSPSYSIDTSVGKSYREVPAGGDIGQVVTKLTSGYGWEDYLKVYNTPASLPETGLDNVLYYVVNENKLYVYTTEYVAITNSRVYSFTNNNNKLQFIKTEDGTTTTVYEIDLAKFGITATSTEINNVAGTTGNIQTQINNEVINRANADITINARIDNLDYTHTVIEHQFITNINQSQGQIDATFNQPAIADVLNLQPTLDSINTSVSNEVNRATAAEGTLQSSLENEATSRANADVTLQSNIDDESSIRQATDTSLQTNITNEVARAESAESNLTAQLNTESTTRFNADTNLATSIAVERTRAQSAEQSNSEAISTETTNRENADSNLQININTETTRAQNAEDSLASSITTEANERRAGDNTLTAAIANEASIRSSEITTEASTRATADTNINTRITAEVGAEETARISADTALSERIENLEARGRYLSTWNCTNGLPGTEPTTTPYTYKSGDYFVVSTVAASGGTNYKPNGSSYTGAASTTVETAEVNINDFYIYDSNVWKLLSNTQKTVTFGNITGSPYDNTNLSTALNNKVDKVTGKGLSTNDFDNTYKGNVDSNTSARHTHSNKALLDTYDQTNANLTDAVSKKHEHSNKSKLDRYTSAGSSTQPIYVASDGTPTATTYTVEKSVPSDAVFTDTKPKYNGTTVTSETNIPEVKTSTWDAKSTVSVSATGTSTSKVTYITVDGTEYKMADEPTEQTVKLAADLYTYTPIGKITGASATNPKKVASAGDALKAVFNAILGEETDSNPTINQGGTTFKKTDQTGTTSASGAEIGQSINAQDGTVTYTVTNTATCSYGLKTASYDTYSKTSVTTFNYPIKSRTISSSTYQVRISYPDLNGCTLSVTTGTLVYNDTTNKYLYCNVDANNKVTVKIAIPAGTSTSSAQTRFGQLSADVEFNDATYNNETVTNFWTYLKASYTASGMSHSAITGVKSDAYTITAGTRYAYSKVTSSATTPTSSLTKQAAESTFGTNGADFTYSLGDYIYLYRTGSGKTVYTYVLGQWAAVTATQLSATTITQANGATCTYYPYRIGPMEASGTAKYRV